MGLRSQGEAGRLRRHRRVRKRVAGSPDRPRLLVHRSHQHLYAQVIDDTEGKTRASCSTRDPEFRKIHPKGGSVEAASQLGKLLGDQAKAAGIKRLVFDRGGYLYHGRVKALAEGLRSSGLEI